MTKNQLTVAFTVAIVLVTANAAVTSSRGAPDANQGTSQPDQRDESVDESLGFPVRIAYSSSRKSGEEYRWRTLFVLLDYRYCSPDILRDLFNRLAERCRESNFIKIDVYSDPEMLRRAVERDKRGYDIVNEMTLPDTPEGEELEKALRGDLYIPKNGWAWARYYSNPKEGDKFYYKPDQTKVDMVEVVIKAANAPTYTGDLQADLFLACKLGDLPKAAVLVGRGAKVDDKDERGEAPLVYAVAHNRPEIVRLLLAHGAKVDARNRLGQTALCLALSSRSEEIVFMLLEHGADVNASYGHGITPLHLASRSGLAEAAAALLAKGANPNARGENGKTPIFDAIWGGQVVIVQALLERGASTRVRNDHGETAEDFARKLGDQPMIEVLMRRQ